LKGPERAPSLPWRSAGGGGYLAAGGAGVLVDQPFLPCIATEGELRVVMMGGAAVELLLKRPKRGGLSATLGSGARYERFAVGAPRFAALVRRFVDTDVRQVMAALGLGGCALPLLWTADFIKRGGEGRDEDEKEEKEKEGRCNGQGAGEDGSLAAMAAPPPEPSLPAGLNTGLSAYAVGEFNCSCVGFTQQLHLAGRVAREAIAITTAAAAARRELRI
jgi:hypothetical protein